MTEKDSSQDANKILFVHLITMLSMSAMQQLGKIINPATGKTEVNLEAAQATIDLLDMLAARTRGNLDADEERFLKDTLSALKMNFVETMEERQRAEGRRQNGKPQKSGAGDQKPAEEPQDAKPAGKQSSETSGTEDATAGMKDPKFHKSYD